MKILENYKHLRQEVEREDRVYSGIDFKELTINTIMLQSIMEFLSNQTFTSEDSTIHQFHAGYYLIECSHAYAEDFITTKHEVIENPAFIYCGHFVFQEKPFIIVSKITSAEEDKKIIEEKQGSFCSRLLAVLNNN